MVLVRPSNPAEFFAENAGTYSVALGLLKVSDFIEVCLARHKLGHSTQIGRKPIVAAYAPVEVFGRSRESYAEAVRA